MYSVAFPLRPALRATAVGTCLLMAGCAGDPLVPFSADTPPLVLMPTAQAGVDDQRARFREIYCMVLAAPPQDIPDHRPCEEALTRLASEAAPSGKPVAAGSLRRGLEAVIVPGIGYACIEPWLQSTGEAAARMRERGFELSVLRVDALSSSTRNATQVRDAVLAMPQRSGSPRLVLVGYSKGIADILEAVVAYPQIRSRVAAVVSVAGAVGGSPLANDAEQYMADMMQHFPGASCGPGDGGAVSSLRTGVRQAWLAAHPLPRDLRFYSVVTLPRPERISAILAPSHRKLSRVDARNDSQVIFSDQVVPGSTLLGYLNADHWAVAVPLSRTHPTLASVFVTHNAYPREAMLEAVLRFIEEDMDARSR
jgi:hypothetical protein